MFGICHFIWIGISVLLTVLCTVCLKKAQLSLQKVLSLACAVGVISEVVKTLTMLQAVPSADGSMMFLYLDVSQLPLHLCSIQLLLLFFARFTRSASTREYLLAFMYPTGVLGGLFAIALPPVFTGLTPLQAFTSPRVYQYFAYHVMLITLGIYIAASGCIRFRLKHLFSSLGILGALGFATLYLNSMFAAPVYQNGQLVSVEYMPNFFFTQQLPIPFPLTEKWHWLVWWGVILLLAILLISLCILPLIRRDRKYAQTPAADGR